jgi:tRNA nucleotidyltransferase (CCA-adding enzyme)
MVGEDFAALLNDYLNYLGLETKTVAIIQANPGQSKHLVTANIHLDLSGFWALQNPSAEAPVPGAFKYDLDCVNLRAETYADDSRIPAMRFGTALEDALRRDFTINALFFNCMTGRVEDLTGHGMEDLGSRLVRTPLPPSVTFLDDPLRILRAVRFASRFDYRLHADIGRTVCSQPAVAVAFACKVSKERVCKEMDGALGGKLNRPPLALWLVFRLGLLDKIFSVPTLEALEADGRTLLCPQREGGCSWMVGPTAV